MVKEFIDTWHGTGSTVKRFCRDNTNAEIIDSSAAFII